MGGTKILAEQQPPPGVLVCDHVGLITNSHVQAAVLEPPYNVRLDRPTVVSDGDGLHTEVFVSHDESITWFWKANLLMKSLPYCFNW